MKFKKPSVICIGLLFTAVLVAADPTYVGLWQSVKGTPQPMSLELAVVEGYDLVFTQGKAQVKANFDGRDYHPVAGPEIVRIARVGSNGFSVTVSFEGIPRVFDTFTVSADGQTLTQVGGPIGQPPSHTIVYERRK